MTQNGKATLPPNEEADDRKRLVMSALEKYEQRLTRYAQRMFGTTSHDNLEEARDAVQHTFMKLCEQKPSSVETKLGPWLYTVCRNRVIDQIRKSGNSTGAWPPLHEVVDGEPGPHDLAAQGEFLQRLSKLIGRLTGVEREIIELWSQGFNHREISEVLSKSQTSVRVGLHRGLKKLKRHPEVCRWLERATSPDRQHSTGSFKFDSGNGKSNADLAISKQHKAITQGGQS